MSGVGAGGAGGDSAPPKVLICQKFGQNPRTFGQRSLDFFNIINEIMMLCYWVHQQNLLYCRKHL